MGRGIAQIAASGGDDVVIWDAQAGAAEDACQFIHSMFSRAAEKGRISRSDADAAAQRIRIANGLEDFASAELVVEAIVERLDAKRGLFQQLDGIVPDKTVLATNTSSLSVTAIGAGTRNPERVAGFHFFNPVPLMKVVEVIPGARTAPAVVEALCGLAERWGHRAVRASDTPGFLVNHAGRGLYTEGLRIVQEGVASPETVDAILRQMAGFRMGPFELLDLTGIDVSFPVMEQIYSQFYQEPRFRPTPLAAQRVSAGLLGRKSGEGFYKYEDGRKIEPASAPSRPAPENARFWIDADVPEHGVILRDRLSQAGFSVETGAKPSAEATCLLATIGVDASTAVSSRGLNPARCLAVDMLFGVDSGLTLMTNPATAESARIAAHGALSVDGKPVFVISDSAGFVAQRVVAMIVNIACDIAQQKIASPQDIDDAVTLGLGYPKGPLALGDQIGAPRILNILEGLQSCYGDPRYRPSPWLRRRAQLGLSLRSGEGA